MLGDERLYWCLGHGDFLTRGKAKVGGLVQPIIIVGTLFH